MLITGSFRLTFNSILYLLGWHHEKQPCYILNETKTWRGTQIQSTKVCERQQSEGPIHLNMLWECHHGNIKVCCITAGWKGNLSFVLCWSFPVKKLTNSVGPRHIISPANFNFPFWLTFGRHATRTWTHMNVASGHNKKYPSFFIGCISPIISLQWWCFHGFTIFSPGKS